MDDRDHALQRDGWLTVRRVAIAIATLALLALVGLLVSHAAGRRGRDSTAAAPTGDHSALHPVTGASAVDIDGARSAAVVAVASTGAVVRAGMFSRLDILERLATPSYAPVLASETTAQVNEFVVALGASGVDPSDLHLVETPITATATAAGEAAVAVEVWSVLVVSVPDSPVARQAWRTVTLDMVDVDGRWLVDSWTSTAGPAPALPPDGQIAGRADVDARLAWPPVAGGGHG